VYAKLLYLNTFLSIYCVYGQFDGILFAENIFLQAQLHVLKKTSTFFSD